MDIFETTKTARMADDYKKFKVLAENINELKITRFFNNITAID